MPEGVITGLRAQERDPQRVNVFIDHTFAIGISLNTLADEGLFVGKAIDAPTWARLEASEHHERAFQRALRFLQSRPRSTHELRQRLRRAEYPTATIDAVVHRLTTLGLLDDAEFARLWIEKRQSHRPRSAALLRAELLQKGLDRELVDMALEAAHDPADDTAQAYAAAQAVLARYATAPDWQTFERRMGSYLQRRGFRFDTIHPVVRDLWQQIQHDAPASNSE